MDVNPQLPAMLEGDRIRTRIELEREVEAFVSRLHASGLGLADRIGLAAEASSTAVVALLGLLRSGVTAIPVGTRLTAPEREAIRLAAGLRALYSNGKLELIRGAPERSIDRDIPAIVVPTSGTTARPKLVRLTSGQLEASADAWAEVLPPATGWLLSLALAHVSGIGIVIRAQRAGVPIVLTKPGEAFVESFTRAREHGVEISHVSMVATQLAWLLEGGVAPPRELRAVILGGGPIPESLVTAAAAAGWPVVPSYGLTETASGCVAVPVGEAAARPWSAGRPMPGVELRIDAPDAGGTGEILVRGPMVFSGYEGDAALTAAALERDGWLHTGDLGSVDAEGWLRVAGRRDEMIISGGENVAPVEVEAALAAHAAVADVAVTAFPDERWGQVPVALAVFHAPPPERPAIPARPSAEELRAFAGERLASFKVPARFLEVDRLPRTGSGKLVRRHLPVLVAAAGQRSQVRDVLVVEADDGQLLCCRDLPGPEPAPGGPPPPTVLLAHGTLLTSSQFLRLGYLLQPHARVLAIDRRGSGASKMERPAPIQTPRHVADLVAALDAAGVERAVLFGHSFGANVCLELAARHPDRVVSVVVYEPPYLALAGPELAARLAPLPAAVASAFACGGSALAAETFLRAVAGDAVWEGLSPPQRAFAEAEGAGALADSTMDGIDPDGLARIACPVVVASGDASDDFYVPLADAVAGRIPGARRLTLAGLSHGAPIADPAPFAELVRSELGLPSARPRDATQLSG
jgi:O-succinylbenzoic acid--CoA ligase